MGRMPYTLTKTITLPVGTSAVAFEIKHDNALPFVCDERDVVVRVSGATAPFPANYPLPRNSAHRGLTSGETELPTIDMVRINYNVRDLEAQSSGQFVSLGSFASREDRALQRTSFMLNRQDFIKGSMINDSASALTVELNFKGYLENVPGVPAVV